MSRTTLVAVVSILVSAGAAPGRAAAHEARVLSPDGAVCLQLFPHDGRLHYQVTFRNRPVIESSPLVVTADGVDLTAGVEIGESKPYQVDETYPWRGVHSQAVNRCNGTTIHVQGRQSGDGYTL